MIKLRDEYKLPINHRIRAGQLYGCRNISEVEDLLVTIFEEDSLEERELLLPHMHRILCRRFLGVQLNSPTWNDLDGDHIDERNKSEARYTFNWFIINHSKF